MTAYTNGHATSGGAKANHYDVAILGTGISGSMLGAILARHGVHVLLIDAGQHPRFAVGESTVPHTSRMLEIMADRYDVPELANLSAFSRVCKHIGTNCGVKRNFGFVYSRPNQPPNYDESTQFVIPGFLLDYESHMFRQDVDAYMLHAAVRYGAVTRQNTFVKDVDIDANGVRLITASGEEFQARYIVDAGGYRSPLADKFGLREKPSRLKAHTRTLFTHMINVRRYDDVVPRGAYKNPSPWHEGTLHHMFDGGWVWVIPFNNHRYSTNPLISVGLTVDPRRFPRELPPEEEWRQFLERFPHIAEQFKYAKAVREWVSTDRLQYSSSQTVGDRFCMMAHAGGFIDPLFSRGLAATMDIVNAVAHRLIDAVKDDDFSAERFAFVEKFQQRQLDHNDRLVNCSFIAFRDFNLWNAWFRLWGLGQGFGEIRLIQAHLRFQETRDPAVLNELELAPYTGLLFPISDAYKQLWEGACSTVEAVEAGQLSPEVATQRILDMLAQADFGPPFFDIADPKDRFLRIKLLSTPPRAISWQLFAPPSQMKDFQNEGNKLFLRRLRSRQRL